MPATTTRPLPDGFHDPDVTIVCEDADVTALTNHPILGSCTPQATDWNHGHGAHLCPGHAELRTHRQEAQR